MAEIEGLTAALRRLQELALDTRKVERPLEAIGVYMLGSVEKNFQQQGRPDRWSPLNPRTIAGRRKGKGKGGPKILIDRARLKNSMNHKVHIGSPSSNVEVGTNVIYGPRHHFGYEGAGKKGRGQSNTPARPFLLIQEEDSQKIEDIFKRHLRRGI
jgi:phage virion morphogenesis protein